MVQTLFRWVTTNESPGQIDRSNGDKKPDVVNQFHAKTKAYRLCCLLKRKAGLGAVIGVFRFRVIFEGKNEFRNSS